MIRSGAYTLYTASAALACFAGVAVADDILVPGDFPTIQGSIDAAADCDGNGALRIVDFICLSQVFEAGCN